MFCHSSHLACHIAIHATCLTLCTLTDYYSLGYIELSGRVSFTRAVGTQNLLQGLYLTIANCVLGREKKNCWPAHYAKLYVDKFARINSENCTSQEVDLHVVRSLQHNYADLAIRAERNLKPMHAAYRAGARRVDVTGLSYSVFGMPAHKMCTHWSHPSQYKARCVFATGFRHSLHGYLVGPGLVSMSPHSKSIQSTHTTVTRTRVKLMIEKCSI